ncbi:MAG: hypothetical protein EON58_19505 [Alphaproteobacteria bacterium]|nr:MAG: hypothetical protein EON58_19505 [Alphaproteobacteria bacterium]
MLRSLAYEVGKRLVSFSGEPIVANMIVTSLVAQAVNRHNVELLDCYQTLIESGDAGVICIYPDGSVERSVSTQSQEALSEKIYEKCS